jgi:glutamine amidotransferase
MSTVAVVDYGMGNLRSVAKAIEHVAPHAQVLVTADPAQVAQAARVVVPGQGAMPDCMRELSERGLRQAVIDAAANKPFLGICIGLQMLFEHSEEGDVPGLGVINGQVRRFPNEAMVAGDGSRLKVPHMGWNEVEQHMDTGPHPMWNGIANGSRFYFVHSYYVEPAQPDVIAGSTIYGIPFTSAVARDNIFAVQFHPEKSAESGLRLLGNFMSWNP